MTGKELVFRAGTSRVFRLDRLNLVADRAYISRGRIPGFMNTKVFAKRVPIRGSVARTILRSRMCLFCIFVLLSKRVCVRVRVRISEEHIRNHAV